MITMMLTISPTHRIDGTNGIFYLHESLIFMVHVGKSTIPGSYGLYDSRWWFHFFSSSLFGQDFQFEYFSNGWRFNHHLEKPTYRTPTRYFRISPTVNSEQTEVQADAQKVGQLGSGRKNNIPTWMSRWKIGSMVRKWAISPTYKWGIPWGYI